MPANLHQQIVNNVRIARLYITRMEVIMYTYPDVPAQSCSQTHTHTYTHKCTHTHTYKDTHKNTHTHKNTQNSTQEHIYNSVRLRLLTFNLTFYKWSEHSHAGWKWLQWVLRLVLGGSAGVTSYFMWLFRGWKTQWLQDFCFSPLRPETIFWNYLQRVQF